MERESLVYVDLDGAPHLVGRLWARARRNRESASFEYDKSWLSNLESFALEPALSLGEGTFHTQEGREIFGAIGRFRPRQMGARAHAPGRASAG